MLVTSSTVIHIGWYSSLFVDVSNKKPEMYEMIHVRKYVSNNLQK